MIQIIWYVVKEVYYDDPTIKKEISREMDSQAAIYLCEELNGINAHVDYNKRYIVELDWLMKD